MAGTIDFADSHADSYGNTLSTESYDLLSQSWASPSGNDEKQGDLFEGVDALESRGRDQEVQALREANATLTQRLAQMAEMMETRSEAPPPSYFANAV